MKITFKIFHESHKEQNAARAIRKMQNHNQINFTILKVEKYLNKGCLATCEKEIKALNWQELFFNVTIFAQSFAYAWSISDDLQKCIYLTTTRFNVGDGVTMAHIYIAKNSFYISSEQ